MDVVLSCSVFLMRTKVAISRERTVAHGTDVSKKAMLMY